MKMLLKIVIPHEPFNALVRAGTAGEIIGRILEEIKPEAVYFTAAGGKRGGTFVVDVENASDIPRFAEPFFLNFNADCTFEPFMSPEDLKNSGLDELGKKWG